MKLRLLTSMAGRDFSYSAGDITERFSGEEAKRLISAGFCEAVVEKPSVKRGGKKVETATAVEQGENRG